MTERLERAILGRLSPSPEERILWWNGEWWRTDRFLAFIDDCTEKLRSSGFGKGQRVAALLPNSPKVLALSIAAWRLGGAISPLNAKSGIPSAVGTLELVDPFCVVLAHGLDDLAAALAEKGIPSVFTGADDPLPILTRRDGTPESEDLAVIFATSGTTGLPKAVPLTHGNLYDNATTVFRHLTELHEGDTLLNVLPNFHSFGYTVAGLMPLLCNMKQTILPSFLPLNGALKAMNDSEISAMIVVPTMLSLALSAIEHGATVPGKLRLIVTGGDRLNVQLDERVRGVMGVGPLEGYGLTGCSPVVCVNCSYATRKLGTVGPFSAGYTGKLLKENGEPADGNEGVLWVRGPSVTDRYFRDSVMTAERFSDGWFNTGDYVRIDGEGNVTILDRVTDIIIVGGFNVYPQEVEATLHAHPAIAQAIVVGMPHTVNGEVPMAYVRKKDGAEVTQREIVEYCKSQLAHFKVPRKVEFIDTFPLSSTGKVLRRMLRQKAF